jgi:ABC-type hemin transport system ATPase subunit
MLLSKGRLLAEGTPSDVLTPARISELYEIDAAVAAGVVTTDVRGRA